MAQDVAVGPERGVREAVDGRGGGSRAGVEHDPAGRGIPRAADLDDARADEPAVAAHEAHARLLEALDRDRSSQSSVASSRMRACHGAPVGRDARPTRRAATRRASARVFAARITIFEGMQP